MYSNRYEYCCPFVLQYSQHAESFCYSSYPLTDVTRVCVWYGIMYRCCFWSCFLDALLHNNLFCSANQHSPSCAQNEKHDNMATPHISASCMICTTSSLSSTVCVWYEYEYSCDVTVFSRSLYVYSRFISPLVA